MVVNELLYYFLCLHYLFPLVCDVHEFMSSIADHYLDWCAIFFVQLCCYWRSCTTRSSWQTGVSTSSPATISPLSAGRSSPSLPEITWAISNSTGQDRDRGRERQGERERNEKERERERGSGWERREEGKWGRERKGSGGERERKRESI